MKKLIIATSIMAASLSTMATEVSVSAVRDFNLNANGARVTTELSGLKLSATNVDNQYLRLSVGKEFPLVKVGPVSLSASVSGVSQDSKAVHHSDGYGLALGGKATLAVTKSIDLVASAERFVGQSRVSSYNGNTGTLGLTLKF